MEQIGIDRVINLTFFPKFRGKVSLAVSGTFLFLLILVFPLKCTGETCPESLAVDLFAEGNFGVCIQECSRLIAEDKGNETVLLLQAVAKMRSGKDNKVELKNITESPHYSPATANMARYELARAHWKSGNIRNALEQFKKLFESSDQGPLFLRAGCSINLLIKQYPELAEHVCDIKNQLDTCSSLWSGKIIDECRISPAGKKESIAGTPVQWMISFYRSQISPALGRRCSLQPSCSEYGMQSLKKHGLLGLAMIGDRTVREPDVVANKPSPVRIGNRWCYKDTVEEHDWWMTPGRNRK
ncbi:MAG: membrane protein insertion efficiency factor YidD [Kiritimatiellae bacterium]|nr:membrane protein insertion efficiency factor YidD [Kiritimatiellia bacterium]